MQNSDEKMKSEVFSIVDLFTLMSFDEIYRYIARDKDGELYLYSDKPYKYGNAWQIKPHYKCLRIEGINEHAFNGLKWTDEEPALIPDKNEIEKMIDEKMGKMKSKKIVVRRMNDEK